MVVVTGAAGFIGSCMVTHLNENGYNNIIIVDNFGVEAKRKNWETKQVAHVVERQSLFEWLAQHEPTIECFIHLGARTDTTEFDYAIHQLLNVDYSMEVWNYCSQKQIPLIYASSAATYGDGNLGYNDNHEIPFSLEPLNPYGKSKNEFDKWAVQQTEQPPFWAGLKFFNVYGPNEYHKGRMASVIWHSFNQIKENGLVKLFKSHKEGFLDGQQLRDFVYVKDVVQVILWLMQHSIEVENGLFNLGTGQARSFESLARATFSGMKKDAVIEYIDMPLDIRDKYQYFTEANMQKLIDQGYPYPFTNLEDGVADYVTNYLSKELAIY